MLIFIILPHFTELKSIPSKSPIPSTVVLPHARSAPEVVTKSRGKSNTIGQGLIALKYCRLKPIISFTLVTNNCIKLTLYFLNLWVEGYRYQYQTWLLAHLGLVFIYRPFPQLPTRHHSRGLYNPWSCKVNRIVVSGHKDAVDNTCTKVPLPPPDCK